MKKIVVSLFLIICFTSITQAQFYIGPFVGFKASGLKGVLKLTSGGQVSTGNVADGGNTGFNVGLTVGYQVLPGSILNGIYKLDINIDASYSSFSYLEEGFNSSQGAGRWAALGFDGGGTTVISIDVVPLHRLNFASFQLLSPFVGLGVGLNIMSTSDVDVGPPSTNGVITGKGDFKIGLIVTYGTIIRASSIIQPYLQFKHLIPFGDETEFTDSYQAAGGGGSQSYALSIQDAPGYFCMVGGVRFCF